MTRLNTWTALCLGLVLVATLMSGMSMAQNPTGQDQKDEKIFEGLLMDIDNNAHILTLKEGDREMQFSFTDQTEVVVPDKDKPTVVAQGTKMRVHYMEQEKTNIATKIEIIATTAAR